MLLVTRTFYLLERNFRAPTGGATSDVPSRRYSRRPQNREAAEGMPISQPQCTAVDAESCSRRPCSWASAWACGRRLGTHGAHPHGHVRRGATRDGLSVRGKPDSPMLPDRHITNSIQSGMCPPFLFGTKLGTMKTEQRFTSCTALSGHRPAVLPGARRGLWRSLSRGADGCLGTVRRRPCADRGGDLRGLAALGTATGKALAQFSALRKPDCATLLSDYRYGGRGPETRIPNRLSRRPPQSRTDG